MSAAEESALAKAMADELFRKLFPGRRVRSMRATAAEIARGDVCARCERYCDYRDVCQHCMLAGDERR